MEKIVNIIAQCRFGIHDISRTVVSATTSLPRFNMPFEFGLFLGCKQFGSGRNKAKRILVLDSEAHRYRSSISDIAGQDIAVHGDDPNKAIECVRAWLNSESRAKRIRLPGAREISRRYLAFRNDLPALAKENRLEMSELEKLEYFGDYLELLVAYLKARR
jgi:hypothetical protein